MSEPTRSPARPGHRGTDTREQRRVIAATIIGTTVEWYDFFIYGAAAGLVFDKVFFEAAGNGASIMSFLTVGVSFLFRPLGAFLAGHLGDRYGRRAVLVGTLITMGVATTLIGLLPTYAAIGAAAPILLVVLRILQGISAGGEWGGAALLAVEHAPTGKRGIFGAAPQIGVPLGLLLSSGMMALMAVAAPGDDFYTWGWRVPFVVSIVLVGVGYLIRSRVDESPVFRELVERRSRTRIPAAVLFRRHTPLVIVAALMFAGNNAAGYMTTGGYIQKYATDPAGPVGMDRGDVLTAVAGSALTWLIFTAVSGRVSDRIGRRNTYLLGWGLLILGLLPLFDLVRTGNAGLLFLGLALLSAGLGFTYGPQAALYAELFPASIRLSGASIAYAIGGILGGAFAPMIAASLVHATGTTTSVTIYLVTLAVIGCLATLLLRDRTDIPLDAEHEAEQAAGALHTLR